MMDRASRRGSLAVAAVLTMAASSGQAQNITSVDVSKDIRYRQTSATAVAPDTAAPAYAFGVGVRGTGLASLSPAPTISGPINVGLVGPSFGSGALSYNAQGGSWELSRQYASASERDARFGSGTYTITVNGTAVPLQVTGDAYPNPPMVSFSQGAWIDGKFNFDPARALTITTNAFTAYSAMRGGIHVNWGIGNRGQLAVENPANSMTVTIPAGSYASGQEFGGYVQFGGAVHEYHGAFYGAGGYGAYTFFAMVAQPPPQVFPMTVSSNITPTVANATATFQPRPEDVGTTASVYVFAVAPSTLVQSPPAFKRDGISWKAKGAKADAPVQCVIAQLNASGQLQAVSASGLTAFVTGTLAASGQSVKILDNVATPNIAGTAFYVGYGTSAQQMIASGVNQRALDVAGPVTCDPRPPQTGWWFNPQEGGRGFSIEQRGTSLFMAAFHYEPDGRATWNFAGGSTSIDGSLFTADFMGASGGQTLTGAYRLPNLANAGTVTFAFSDASHGTLVWPGGTTPIERQASVPNGLTLPPQPGVPESGWWWNPQEIGRGFFIEWQGGFVNIAGYMYDEQGRPTWYITVVPTPDPLRITGDWWTFQNGQAIGRPYREPMRTSDNAGALDVQFTSATTATMRLPDGRTIPLVRQAF